VEGGISGYHIWIGTTPGGSNVFSGIINGTTLGVTNSFGVRLYATVTAVNNAGIESPASTPGTGTLLLDPAWVPVASLATPNLLNWSSVLRPHLPCLVHHQSRPALHRLQRHGHGHRPNPHVHQ